MLPATLSLPAVEVLFVKKKKKPNHTRIITRGILQTATEDKTEIYILMNQRQSKLAKPVRQ